LKLSQEIVLEKALRLVESYMSTRDIWEFQATMTSSEITDMFLYSRWAPGVFRRTAAIERQAGRLKGSSEARTGAFQAMSSGSTSILTLVCAAKCAQTCDRLSRH
jgi:hypothetical protein